MTVPWAETGHRDVPLAGERDWLRFGPGRVLVVEDDADSRAALASLFSGWGLDVTALEGDGEALAAYARGPEPACVISDYRLGEGEDGIALIQRLRAIWSQTLPALLVSGDTSADGMGHLVASGIPYLHKPVRPARLRAWLASVIKPKAENHP